MLPSYLAFTLFIALVLLFLISQTALPRRTAILLRVAVGGFVAVAFLFHMFSPLASRPPSRIATGPEMVRFSDGGTLTRRGYYASQILASMLASPVIRSPAVSRPEQIEDTSRRAVEYADALIEALGE